VGVWGTQLAKHFGAEVTGVCSTKNLDVVRALGADHVIDYTAEDVAESGPVFDVVFDAVGKLPRRTATGMVAPGGTYLNVNKHSGSGGEEGHEELAYIIGLIEEGRLETVIDRRFPWEQIVEAHRYVEAGHKTGHVVIDVGE
jgi:NADPH:quinone reductase-like Zn-dependent oxidoreductase